LPSRSKSTPHEPKLINKFTFCKISPLSHQFGEITINRQLIDESYSKILVENKDLVLTNVILLDRIQKKDKVKNLFQALIKDNIIHLMCLRKKVVVSSCCGLM